MSLLSFFTVRHLRLASGLVMFAYITMHLTNHALGLVSLDLAENGLGFVMTVWRWPPMTALLYGATALHFVLALWMLYSRREWHLPWIEILRLAAGLSFPLLLIGHAVTARVGDEFYHIDPSYTAIIAKLLTEGTQGLQLALLAPGWVHGCLGLWISLRRFDTMQRLKPLLAALVIAFPVLAAGGFVRMAREVQAMPPQPVSEELAAKQAALDRWKDDAVNWYLGSIVAAFLLGRAHALAVRRSA
jgi:adenylate cyclase